VLFPIGKRPQRDYPRKQAQEVELTSHGGAPLWQMEELPRKKNPNRTLHTSVTILQTRINTRNATDVASTIRLRYGDHPNSEGERGL
jgi:hypothetical protein